MPNSASRSNSRRQQVHIAQEPGEGARPNINRPSRRHALPHGLRSLGEQVASTMKKYEHLLPEERKPTILMCGKTGNGKTTTINTIFGKNVGAVGHCSRGTRADEVYEWESTADTNINLIDLPGLGDSTQHDRVFREIYRRRIPQADGFLVIVTPPRPAEIGTIKTVKLLLQCGVSAKHIIFGFNKLEYLHYVGDNDSTQRVALDGLIGPVNDAHRQAIREAKAAFLRDIGEAIPKAKFSESQIIEYDSIHGWNMHKLLTAVVEVLPFQTANRVRRAAAASARAARKAEAEKLRREKEELEREKKKAAELMAQRERQLALDRERGEKERREQEHLLAQKQKEIAEKEKKVREREKSLADFDRDHNRFEDDVTKFIVQGVKAVVEVVDKAAAAVFDAVEEIYDWGKKAVNSVKNFFRGWF